MPLNRVDLCDGRQRFGWGDVGRAEDVLGQTQTALPHEGLMKQAKGVLALGGELSIDDAGLAMRLQVHLRGKPVTDVSRPLVSERVPVEQVTEHG